MIGSRLISTADLSETGSNDMGAILLTCQSAFEFIPSAMSLQAQDCDVTNFGPHSVQYDGELMQEEHR